MHKQFLRILFWISMLTACDSSPVEPIQNQLDATLSMQNTKIAQLATHVSEQEQTSASQWEVLSNISTQMPYALKIITPMPPDVTPVPTTYHEGEYPLDTRTGNPEVDTVIEAFLFGENIARTELVQLTESACTLADGFGGPPKCMAGEAEGTLVLAFPVLYSEGVHMRPNELQAIFDFSVRGLVAVYQVPKSAYTESYWPAGEYGIVFTSIDGNIPHTVIVFTAAGKIVRLESNPGLLPSDTLAARSDAFILPPCIPSHLLRGSLHPAQERISSGETLSGPASCLCRMQASQSAP